MSDDTEVVKVAHSIAERFGEPGDRQRTQLARIVTCMGAAWATEIADRADRELADSGPLTKRADGSPRTRGGVFFALARRAAFDVVRQGTLKRRDFYRAFCWRDAKPR